MTTATPAPITFTTIHRALTDGTVEVPAIPTVCPHLVLTPNLRDGGQVRNGWQIVHVPTGLGLPSPMMADVPELLDLAGRVAHLDWSGTDPSEVGARVKEAYTEALRAMEWDNPSPYEKPRQDPWHKNSEGVPRQCLPLMAEVLDWYQRSVERSRDTPLSLEDGSSNPRWHAEIRHQVDLYSIAFLLGAVHQLAGKAGADQVAASLSDALEAGDSLGEWAWSWRESIKTGNPLRLSGVPARVPDELLGDRR